MSVGKHDAEEEKGPMCRTSALSLEQRSGEFSIRLIWLIIYRSQMVTSSVVITDIS